MNRTAKALDSSLTSENLGYHTLFLSLGLGFLLGHLLLGRFRLSTRIFLILFTGSGLVTLLATSRLFALARTARFLSPFTGGRLGRGQLQLGAGLWGLGGLYMSVWYLSLSSN